MDEEQHNDVEPTQEKKRGPVSRGVPSKETLWLDDIRRLRNDWAYHKNVRLELEQLMHLVFPEKYQEIYYKVGASFMKTLFEKQELRGDDIGAFIRDNSYSKATFYNVILPRLRRVGMVRLEREAFTHEHTKQKFYKKIVKPSTQFSKFWGHVSKEYDSLVQTAKARGSD